MPATIDQTTSFATSVSDMSSSTNTKPTCIGILSTVASRRRTLSNVVRDHDGNRTTANSLNQITITLVQTRSSQCTMARMMANTVILIPDHQNPFVSTFTHNFLLLHLFTVHKLLTNSPVCNTGSLPIRTVFSALQLYFSGIPRIAFQKFPS